jgi:hypothetical protein
MSEKNRKRRKRHTPEQIIAKLREADAMKAGGAGGDGRFPRLRASCAPGFGPEPG